MERCKKLIHCYRKCALPIGVICTIILFWYIVIAFAAKSIDCRTKTNDKQAIIEAIAPYVKDSIGYISHYSPEYNYSCEYAKIHLQVDSYLIFGETIYEDGECRTYLSGYRRINEDKFINFVYPTRLWETIKVAYLFEKHIKVISPSYFEIVFFFFGHLMYRYLLYIYATMILLFFILRIVEKKMSQVSK